MVHIPWEATHDVGSSVIWQHRLSRSVENIQHIIHSLNYITVTNAKPLIGWLERELVSTTRIALLVVVQTLEAPVKCWVRFRFLATIYRSALAITMRKAAVNDVTTVCIRDFIILLGDRKSTRLNSSH